MSTAPRRPLYIAARTLRLAGLVARPTLGHRTTTKHNSAAASTAAVAAAVVVAAAAAAPHLMSHKGLLLPTRCVVVEVPCAEWEKAGSQVFRLHSEDLRTHLYPIDQVSACCDMSHR